MQCRWETCTFYHHNESTCRGGTVPERHATVDFSRLRGRADSRAITGDDMDSGTKCRHDEQPVGYLQWHAWAARKSKTHQQVKCDACGLWKIWKRKSYGENMTTAFHELFYRWECPRCDHANLSDEIVVGPANRCESCGEMTRITEIKYTNGATLRLASYEKR